MDVDRGGKLTRHGLGQVTRHPIVRLADPVDVVAHVLGLERVLIDVSVELGLPTQRVQGRSGDRTADDERKVAATGIRVAQWVTLHGYALDRDPDLSAYGRIVPCGIADATVTSLSRERGHEVTTDEALPLLERHVLALAGVVPAA